VLSTAYFLPNTQVQNKELKVIWALLAASIIIIIMMSFEQGRYVERESHKETSKLISEYLGKSTKEDKK
jgi:hypothetical protein